MNKYFTFPLKYEQAFCVRCHPAVMKVCEWTFDFSKWNNTNIKVIAGELSSVSYKNPQSKKKKKKITLILIRHANLH